jgi:hypothetical protein
MEKETVGMQNQPRTFCLLVLCNRTKKADNKVCPKKCTHLVSTVLAFGNID